MKDKQSIGLLIAALGFLVMPDTASAYLKPKMGRWLNRDPIGEPGFALVSGVEARSAFLPRDLIDNEPNTYAYVHNAPVNLIDPDGLKSRVTVDPKTCTITVTLNIGIYGAKASNALATMVASCIELHWSGHTTRKGCAKGTTGSCNVVVAANVKYYPTAQHRWNVPEDNQIKFTGKTRSSWTLFSWGHWEDDTVTARNPNPCWMFAHEAGHLMGLLDDYNYITGNPNPGHAGHMMGEYGGNVVQHEIDSILHGKRCPKQCCCPPASKPGTP